MLDPKMMHELALLIFAVANLINSIWPQGLGKQ